MAFRFQKRIKIAPGIRVNISKSGPSVSLGPKGLTANVKPGRKTRITAGVPGTGLSHTTTIETDTPAQPRRMRQSEGRWWVLGVALLGLLAAFVIAAMTRE